eukprot:151331-Amphidinium_carterae.1
MTSTRTTPSQLAFLFSWSASNKNDYVYAASCRALGLQPNPAACILKPMVPALMVCVGQLCCVCNTSWVVSVSRESSVTWKITPTERSLSQNSALRECAGFKRALVEHRAELEGILRVQNPVCLRQDLQVMRRGERCYVRSSSLSGALLLHALYD